MSRVIRQEGTRRSLIAGLTLWMILVVLFGSPIVSVLAESTNGQHLEIAVTRASYAGNSNRIAIVKPCFTATAYTNAFYMFYSKYMPTPWGEYVTTDLGLLNRTVVSDWGWSAQLHSWFGSEAARALHLVLDETVTVVDEIDVDGGALFDGGVRVYDVLILGFTEYVTQREYNYYKQFVQSGGTLIFMDACNFLAEVTYSNGYLSLTKGHGWEFNGTHAWKSVYHRWPEENRNWIGGNYWKYWTGSHYNYFEVNTSNVVSVYLRTTLGENITTSYLAHEENLLENFTGTEVIGYWNLINAAEYPGHPIAAYMHRYGLGTVIHSGIMASDAIRRDGFLGIFLAACLRFGLTGDIGEWTYSDPLVPADDPLQWTVTMHDEHGGVATGKVSGIAYCDVNFSATTGVLRSCYRYNLDSVLGTATMRVDGEYQSTDNLVIRGRDVCNDCRRLDLNTFLLRNGDYRLVINATWKGIRCPLTLNYTLGELYFTVQNDLWAVFFSYTVTVTAIVCLASVTVAYFGLKSARAWRQLAAAP